MRASHVISVERRNDLTERLIETWEDEDFNTLSNPGYVSFIEAKKHKHGSESDAAGDKEPEFPVHEVMRRNSRVVMYRTHPKWILVLVGSMVALINAILYRTGWGYDREVKLGYPSDLTTRILWHVMGITGALFVLILPWHGFTHHPVAGKTDAKTKILMGGTFCIWFVALVAGEVKNKYSGAGQAFAICWFYLIMYGLTPILFPHPPDRSNAKLTAGYPVVFILLLSELVWQIPDFGDEDSKLFVVKVCAGLMIIIPILRLIYDRGSSLEHDVGYMLLFCSYILAVPTILWTWIPRELYTHRNNHTRFVIFYFVLIFFNWLCYWLPEKFCSYALPEKSHHFMYTIRFASDLTSAFVFRILELDYFFVILAVLNFTIDFIKSSRIHKEFLPILRETLSGNAPNLGDDSMYRLSKTIRMHRQTSMTQLLSKCVFFIILLFEYLSQEAQLGKATFGFVDNTRTLRYLCAYFILIVCQLLINSLVKCNISHRLQAQRRLGVPENYDRPATRNLYIVEKQLSNLWRSDREYWQTHFVFYAMTNVFMIFKMYPIFLKCLVS